MCRAPAHSLAHTRMLKGMIRWQVACSIKEAGHHDIFALLEKQERGTLLGVGRDVIPEDTVFYVPLMNFCSVVILPSFL